MSQKVATPKAYKASLWTRIWKNRMVYTLIIPGLIWYLLFAYGPILGLQLAFKTYKAKLGIWGSPWCGFMNFQNLFIDPDFMRSVWRTLGLNVVRILVEFPAPIIMALMLNEIRTPRYRKVLQTVYTFPHFLSWVIIASVMQNVLAYDGAVNKIIQMLGGNTINFLGNQQGLWPLLFISSIWKGAGWSSIIYLAAISGIDMDQYEAAEIDGASRWQRLVHITLPNLQQIIVVMFILQVGSVMSMGFDQLFNLDNAALGKATETLDMYIYRFTFKQTSDFGFSTAVSLFRSVVNCVLLIIADRGSKAIGGSGLIGGSDD